MNRNLRSLIVHTVLTGLLIAGITNSSKAQSCDAINSTQLKQILVNMGLSPKSINDPGAADKFEIANTFGGLNIPVATEVSPSGNYIWFTVNLGKAPADSATRAMQLLRQNASIQPCQFYVTAKGALMIGMAMENRGITSAVLRRTLDMVLNRVVDSKNYWQ